MNLTNNQLQFAHRARIEVRTDLYRRRIWISRDGRYRVSEFRRLLEGSRIVYWAERRDTGVDRPVWETISRHRSRQAACRACQRTERGNCHIDRGDDDLLAIRRS